MKAAFILFIFLPIFALASDVTGLWRGELYSFSIYSSEVIGRWGDKAYHLDVWSKDIEGTVDGKGVTLTFWSSDIIGVLPCGEVHVNVWSTEVEGVLCGQGFIVTTKDAKESKAVAFDTVIAALLSDFPLPAQGAIRHFLNSKRP